jgi:heterotetrameric sarcosine oxidase delta subunit
MRISCPFCGKRDLGEFTQLGAHVPRPRPDGPDSQPQFFEAVYLRDNLSGRHQELWYHGFGCRSWLVVTRDTRTHEIVQTDFAKEARRP